MTDEQHPSFGVAVVSRTHGTARSLFQSDLKHRETIKLSVHRAVRNRDLKIDWVHPREALVEVEMSLAQWGALVSSIGLGSGVPVTIRSTENEWNISAPPHAPRMAQNLGEVDTAVADLLGDADESLEAVIAAIEGKAGVKVIRDALSYHQSVLRNARSNAKFAVDTLAEAAEQVVSQARSDIESSILNAARLTGVQPIEAPDISKRKIEEK